MFVCRAFLRALLWVGAVTGNRDGRWEAKEAPRVTRVRNTVVLLNKGMVNLAALRKLLKHRASRSGFRARKCSRIERKRAWAWGVGGGKLGDWEPGEWGEGARPTTAGWAFAG